MVASNADAVVKKCGCGRQYTREGWNALEGSAVFNGEDGGLYEQRHCRICQSSITIALVAPMDVDELRRAVRVIDGMRESFNQKFSAQDLLRLIKVCWAGEWDITPDEWTAEQCDAALNLGRPPRFEETFTGYHALDVRDCRCRGCRRAREEAEQAAAAAIAEGLRS